jgi:DamX protein
MAEQNQQNRFITPELTHRSELILHLLEYSNKLVIVKGEPDSGKSTFCQELISQEESNLIIRNLTLSITTKTNDIFKAIIDGSSHDELQEAAYSQADLNQWLTRCQNKQQIPALLIDNADLFDDESISYLFEILTNSNEASVLHICLFCEPSFLGRLEEFGINKDDSDSLHIIEMPDLSEKQTEQYIRNNYPLENLMEDSSDLNLFDDNTIKQIHRISHGLPGRINALCEQYLDDPAKKSEVVEEKTSINIKAFFLKNRLVLIVIVLLMFLSVGVATLLQQTGKEDVKQTIKLALPKHNEAEDKQDDIVKIEVAQNIEPEPVTIDELSPPVIPEIANDLNNKTEVVVYNSQGQIVAKESDIQTAVEEARKVEARKDEARKEQEIVEEEIIEESVPFSNSTSNIEVISEPEPVKVPELKPKPKPEPKVEPLVKDIKWLTKQDPKKYVLQLIGAYEQETIDVYLKAFKDSETKIISFTASNKGKEWHVLIYGLYQSRDQAVAAIETLPTRAKLMAPWPRSVQSIKDLLQ